MAAGAGAGGAGAGGAAGVVALGKSPKPPRKLLWRAAMASLALSVLAWACEVSMERGVWRGERDGEGLAGDAAAAGEEESVVTMAGAGVARGREFDGIRTRL
jgi:hypothetical protein